MWKISGPPCDCCSFGELYFRIKKIYLHFQSKFKGGLDLEKNCQLIIWDPKLLAVLAKWGSANQPTMVQFYFVYKIVNTKLKLKGVNLMKIIAIIRIWGHLEKKGVCQSAQKGAFEIFKAFSCTKFKLKGDQFYGKKYQLM